MAVEFSFINLGKFAKPLNTLIIKLADAVGILYEPTKIRKKAQAEADAAFIAAANQLKLDELSQRALKRFFKEESIKQSNIESILEKTFPEINDSADPTQLSNEWLLYFFDHAKCASDEELQTIWAKILAGETNKHGSFSKSTLRILSEMSQEDARAFMKTVAFTFKIEDEKHMFIYDFNDEIVKQMGITFDSVNRLDNLGLLSCGSTFGYNVSGLPKNASASYSSKKVEISFKSKENCFLECGQAILSQPGNELLKICSPNYSDEIFNYVYQKWATFEHIEKIEILE